MAPTTPVHPTVMSVRVNELIIDLNDITKRAAALTELTKYRQVFPGLGAALYCGPGTIAVLMQEITASYPFLTPASLSDHASSRVCSTLSLLQAVAADASTRPLIVDAHIHLFLYPFLNTVSAARAYEYMRCNALGVVAALARSGDRRIVRFLLETEVVPLCLKVISNGTELSVTVAIFVIQKIVLDDVGLAYICATPNRFFALTKILGTMVRALTNTDHSRPLKHVIRVYLRLTDHPDGKRVIRRILPRALQDMTFHVLLEQDRSAKYWRAMLLSKLGLPLQGTGLLLAPSRRHGRHGGNAGGYTGRQGDVGDAYPRHCGY